MPSQYHPDWVDDAIAKRHAEADRLIDEIKTSRVDVLPFHAKPDRDLIVASLRAYAAPAPAAPAEVREMVCAVVSSEAVHGAFRRHSNSTEAIKAWTAMSAIPADDWAGIMYAISADVADAALSAISTAGYRITRDAPTQTANCAHCGRIVDTRETKDGGDEFGCQLSDGRWSCSADCYDALIGDVHPADAPARPTVGETWETETGPVMVVPVDDREAEFEVWQGGIPVASAFGRLAGAANEVRHYALFYGQDGPVEIKRVIRFTVDLAAVAKEKPHAG